MNVPLLYSETAKKILFESRTELFLNSAKKKKFRFKFEADSFRRVLGYGKRGGGNRDFIQILSNVNGK